MLIKTTTKTTKKSLQIQLTLISKSGAPFREARRFKILIILYFYDFISNLNKNVITQYITFYGELLLVSLVLAKLFHKILHYSTGALLWDIIVKGRMHFLM